MADFSPSSIRIVITGENGLWKIARRSMPCDQTTQTTLRALLKIQQEWVGAFPVNEAWGCSWLYIAILAQ